jgi:Protein of unknown function (DUF992)
MTTFHANKLLAANLAATVAAAALLSPSQAVSQPAPSLRAGTLQCDVSGGVGLIVGSTRDLECVFEPVEGPNERYVGTVRHAGLDVGVTGPGVMVWSVLASTSRPRNALAGAYVGAQASGTLGLGLGANALLGGNDRSIALQPLSVQAQTGLNVALGVAELTLRPVARGR